ncbi:hypothetical protein F4778DRAFT_778468 [Xylariomycetidae sp. FL2044]|nr:hypothetical protein F4778DRAFT_778468 [Xylariomycetidae sp. FL2044]
MQIRSLLVLLSASALTSASPLLRKRCNNSTTTPETTTPEEPTTVTPTPPLNNGATTLPSPGDAVLKHIVVGHGVQNYTCSDAGVTASSLGALAVLWEITALYPGAAAGSMSQADWDGLTSKVLRTTDLPLNLNASSTTTSASSSSISVDTSAPFPAPADLDLGSGTGTLNFLGHHYFDASNTPTFDLSASSSGTEVFRGKKDLGIAAPATADKGLGDEGAVDWLELSDKGTSENLSLVYRVLTSGGNPAACGAAGQTESVAYTAMYWLYGPAAAAA